MVKLHRKNMFEKQIVNNYDLHMYIILHWFYKLKSPYYHISNWNN